MPLFPRRQFLTGLGALAANVRKGDAAVTSRVAALQNSAQACIFVNLGGAPSHVDTFDFKAGSWTPGDASPQQGAGGIVLSRTLFPQLSRITGDLCLLRSIESWEAAHERGQFYLQTAHSSNPAFNVETPHIGAVVALEKGGGKFPPFLALNGPVSQGSAFLGGQVEPVAAPASQYGFSTLEHAYYGEHSQNRFEQLYRMLQEMDSVRSSPYDKLLADHSAYYDTAKRLMYDQTIAGVFKMTDEERGRYGDSPFGRACIVARNAVRAANGVRFISLSQEGWDTHQGMFDRGYIDSSSRNLYVLANELDRGIGALAADLKASGHFASTLIVMMGEFGRTPGPLNGRGGRDHHKLAMCAAMLGGGVRGGRVIGATDKNGERIVTPGWKQNRQIYIEDIAATIYSALGIDYTKVVTDTPSGRRFEYVSTNQIDPAVITEVFGS